MKILISGAGIAGNACAFFLARQGHAVTVVERYPDIRASGLQIDLRGHGVTVLRRMGLEAAFRARAVAEQGLAVVDKAGRRVAYFPANRSGKGIQSFTSDYEIMRSDLANMFHDAVRERAAFVFGTSIERYAEDEDGVDVVFANGTEHRFDLIIGADGLGSRTRRMMQGPGAKDAFCPIRGVYAAYFHADKPAKAGEAYNASMYLGSKRRGYMIRRSNPDRIQVYLGCQTESTELKEARSGEVDRQKKELARIFEGEAGISRELISAMLKADDFYLERMGVVKLDKWSKGRVVCVGDAAYCPSANTGMGTTSGLVGSYILAGEIGKHCSDQSSKSNISTAFKAYEDKFRPFMTQVQKGIAEGESGFDRLMYSAIGRFLGMQLLAVASLLKLNIFGWFLKEEVKDWDLPEYDLKLD